MIHALNGTVKPIQTTTTTNAEFAPANSHIIVTV